MVIASYGSASTGACKQLVVPVHDGLQQLGPHIGDALGQEEVIEPQQIGRNPAFELLRWPAVAGELGDRHKSDSWMAIGDAKSSRAESFSGFLRFASVKRIWVYLL